MTSEGATPSSEQSAEGTVTVIGDGSGRYTQQIDAGHHRLLADEPMPVSEDRGPTPYDLLLGALGACTAMTVRMYAIRKNWPLEQIRVTLRHRRIHAKDCADCEASSSWIEHIDRHIELTGALEDTQRQRLLYIADRCPVHRTLTSQVQISTTAS
jgi:putative redox protein